MNEDPRANDYLYDIDVVRFVAKIGKLLQDRSVRVDGGGVVRVARVEFDYDIDGTSDQTEPFLRREGLDRDGPLVVAVSA